MARFPAKSFTFLNVMQMSWKVHSPALVDPMPVMQPTKFASTDQLTYRLARSQKHGQLYDVTVT